MMNGKPHPELGLEARVPLLACPAVTAKDITVTRAVGPISATDLTHQS